MPELEKDKKACFGGGNSGPTPRKGERLCASHFKELPPYDPFSFMR